LTGEKTKKLNVNAKEFDQARVNGGSNYDSQLEKDLLSKGSRKQRHFFLIKKKCLLVDLTTRKTMGRSAATQPGTGEACKKKKVNPVASFLLQRESRRRARKGVDEENLLFFV
jgi:hypothetical protein